MSIKISNFENNSYCSLNNLVHPSPFVLVVYFSAFSHIYIRSLCCTGQDYCNDSIMTQYHLKFQNHVLRFGFSSFKDISFGDSVVDLNYEYYTNY